MYNRVLHPRSLHKQALPYIIPLWKTSSTCVVPGPVHQRTQHRGRRFTSKELLMNGTWMLDELATSERGRGRCRSRCGPWHVNSAERGSSAPLSPPRDALHPSTFPLSHYRPFFRCRFLGQYFEKGKKKFLNDIATFIVRTRRLFYSGFSRCFASVVYISKFLK